jgi:hypothetical protein
MNTTQTGWFRVASSNPKFGLTLCYRCEKCGISYAFGDEKEPKAYCCGVWLAKPSEGFFSKLPTVQAEPVRNLTVLHAPNIDFGVDQQNA